MIIAVDFDGTCVTHEYPNVGEDIGAASVLRYISNRGHKIILNTMRSGKELRDAVDWFKNNKIDLWGVNENPQQNRWTDSPKVYANLYIDDVALGCPIKVDLRCSNRPFVDWIKIYRMFSDIERGVFVNKYKFDWENIRNRLMKEFPQNNSQEIGKFIWWMSKQEEFQ